MKKMWEIKNKINKYLNKRKNLKFIKNIKIERFKYKIQGDLLSVYIKQKTLQFDITSSNNWLVNSVIFHLVENYRYFDKEWTKYC